MESFNEKYCERTKKFAVKIVKLVSSFSHSLPDNVMGRQLLRSATSVAANTRAAARVRSKTKKINPNTQHSTLITQHSKLKTCM